MATHSSTLAWKIPWMEAPCRLHEVARSWTGLSDFPFTFHFHALEKEMAIHSSVLAWRIPGTGEPGGLPSMGSHRVRQDWSDLAAASAARPRKHFCIVAAQEMGERISIESRHYILAWLPSCWKTLDREVTSLNLHIRIWKWDALRMTMTMRALGQTK